MSNHLPLYGLMAITAITHIYVGLDRIPLLLNGLGYLALIAYHVIVEDRGYGGIRHVYVVFGYTLITFLGYFVIWLPQDGLAIFTEQPLAIFTKVVELGILFLLYRQIAKAKQ